VKKTWLLTTVLFIIAACSQSIGVNDGTFFTTDSMQTTATPFQPGEPIEPVLTRVVSVGEDVEITAEEPPIINEERETISLGVAQTVPVYIKSRLVLGNYITRAVEVEQGDVFLAQTDQCEEPVEMVYALVAPFPTVRDGVSLIDLLAVWEQSQSDLYTNQPLLMTSETKAVFDLKWGKAHTDAVEVVAHDVMLTIAWETRQYAIIPFHELSGRWKVIDIDGMTVLDANVANKNLPLTAYFCLTGSAEVLEQTTAADYSIGLPGTNRDITRMTSIVMTGVTALVRATGNKMEVNGIQYPGEKIAPWLLEADFTHISNEVAFAESCPYPDPFQQDLRFCSRPNYIELLEGLDIDIIELTGNHIQDWGPDDFLKTLDMYDEYGMSYYGGGANLEEAKQPLLFEHNGNKFAFIGCNAVGPLNAWATDYSSGNANCTDYGWLRTKVEALSSDGYLVIVTLQHNEFYSMRISGPQLLDFNPLARAGAVIVSGSQAHYPHPFGFEGDNFIHYGLGNLFFDQMDAYITTGIQRLFIDRHIFFDGRYISTQVLTAYLEDFAQPRPMTEEERRLFLEEAFRASGW
jgi:hypothetical protein